MSYFIIILYGSVISCIKEKQANTAIIFNLCTFTYLLFPSLKYQYNIK